MSPSILSRLFHREISAPLAALHLILVVGAGHHAGDHAGDLIDWLPAEYHQHDHALSDQPAKAIAVADDCIACKLSRPKTTLPEAALADGERPARSTPRLRSQWSAPSGPDLTARTNRGPPLG